MLKKGVGGRASDGGGKPSGGGKPPEEKRKIVVKPDRGPKEKEIEDRAEWAKVYGTRGIIELLSELVVVMRDCYEVLKQVEQNTRK